MSVPPAVYNVRDFGAVGDGKADDLPVFKRILDLIANDPTRPALGNRGGGIYVPQGEYFLNGNLLWQDTNVLEGVCYDFFQVHEPCILKFAAGCGIVVMGSRDPFGHRGDASCIKHLTLIGSKLSIPTYECDHYYNEGEIVTLPHDPRFVYECVQSGTTCARPAPAWPAWLCIRASRPAAAIASKNHFYSAKKAKAFFLQ